MTSYIKFNKILYNLIKFTEFRESFPFIQSLDDYVYNEIHPENLPSRLQLSLVHLQ